MNRPEHHRSCNRHGNRGGNGPLPAAYPAVFDSALKFPAIPDTLTVDHRHVGHVLALEPSCHPVGLQPTGNFLAGVFGNLRRVAIRWDPEVVPAYRCSRCEHGYDLSAPITEKDAATHLRVPIDCLGEGDGQTHDFRPVVPQEMLDRFWPELFPNPEKVLIIVGSEMCLGSGKKASSGCREVFHGAEGVFYQVDDAEDLNAEIKDSGKRATGAVGRESVPPAPFRLVREIQKRLGELVDERCIAGAPPQCCVLLAMPYTATEAATA